MRPLNLLLSLFTLMMIASSAFAFNCETAPFDAVYKHFKDTYAHPNDVFLHLNYGPLPDTLDQFEVFASWDTDPFTGCTQSFTVNVTKAWFGRCAATVEEAIEEKNCSRNPDT